MLASAVAGAAADDVAAAAVNKLGSMMSVTDRRMVVFCIPRDERTGTAMEMRCCSISSLKK